MLSYLAEAVRMMWEGDCGTLPVIADGGKVIGMITDRDIAIAAGTRNRLASEIRVSEAMSQAVHSCTPDEHTRCSEDDAKRESASAPSRQPCWSDGGAAVTE